MECATRESCTSVLKKKMKTFALNYKLHKDEDLAILNKLMAAWDGQQVADSTWILKRNDGCTCQIIMDDLLEHISADNEISVVEIKTERRQASAH